MSAGSQGFFDRFSIYNVVATFFGISYDEEKIQEHRYRLAARKFATFDDNGTDDGRKNPLQVLLNKFHSDDEDEADGVHHHASAASSSVNSKSKQPLIIKTPSEQIELDGNNDNNMQLNNQGTPQNLFPLTQLSIIECDGRESVSYQSSRQGSGCNCFEIKNNEKFEKCVGWCDKILQYIGIKNMTKIKEHKNEHRAYFTYWITLIQILICIISTSKYGFAAVGWQYANRSEYEVMQPSLAIEKVCWFDYYNIWGGPRLADMVRLGACYSPCMRRDENLIKYILRPDKEIENRSACCARNDGSVCYQTTQENCSPLLSEWLKWPKSKRTNRYDDLKGRSSGSVCGLDPAFCEEPVSEQPFYWPDDLTKWPICRRQKNISANEKMVNPHMACKEITGRPCCVGIKGECLITSQEHCDLMRGNYHPNASLCAQVNCLSEMCGLIPFDQPNQFYRLLYSIFICPGLIHLTITVIVQFFFIRDLEWMYGWHKISFVYFLSGITANIFSAVFLPYQVQAGPYGSLCGVLALNIIEFQFARKSAECSGRLQTKLVIFRYATCIFILLVAGFLLPWLDNYAAFGGLVSGLFLSYLIVPFPKEYISKYVILIKMTFGFLWLCIFMTLLISFYVYPIYYCPFCKYLNCVPFTSNFCVNMDVNVTERTVCSSRSP